MLLYKKIIIVFIILVASYIIWRLILKQNEVRKVMQEMKQNISIEGMTDASGNSSSSIYNVFTTINSELMSVRNSTTPVTIKPYLPAYNGLPLRQFVIKGSYNSAVTGNYVNKDMVTYILQRGCRYLDFEIFYINKKAVVSYSIDPSYQVLSTDGTIELNDVLSTIVLNLSLAPNNTDPLFINMRIKSNDPAIYPLVAASVDHNLNSMSLLYKGNVNKNTLINKLNNKIILMIDKTINPHYKRLCDCSNSNPCYDLRKYINMETGTENLIQQPYTQIINQTWNTPNIMNDQITTDIQKMRIIVPDPVILGKNAYSKPPPPSPYANSNPPLAPFIKQQGCQLIPYRFYILDTTSSLGIWTAQQTLAEYEDFFNQQNSAFVPLAVALHNL